MTDSLIITMKLKSGGFESSISVPVGANDKEQGKFIGAWMKTMVAGLKVQPTKKDTKS